MVRLEVITGPMFSGKSEELLRRLKRAAYADQRILLLKPAIDSRKTRDIFRLEEKDQKLAGYKNLTKQTIGSPDDLKDECLLLEYDILAIDEVHFFGAWFEKILINVLETAQSLDITIIVSGLDMDYLRQPFGMIMPNLLARADEIIKLTAVCAKCKGANGPAIFTQKKTETGKHVEIGDEELYEARCRVCHYIPSKNPA